MEFEVKKRFSPWQGDQIGVQNEFQVGSRWFYVDTASVNDLVGGPGFETYVAEHKKFVDGSTMIVWGEKKIVEVYKDLGTAVAGHKKWCQFFVDHPDTIVSDLEDKSSDMFGVLRRKFREEDEEDSKIAN
jgi:Sec-independent protein translocase protein TatA